MVKLDKQLIKMTCQLIKDLSELISNRKNDEARMILKNIDPRNLVNDQGSSLLHIAAEKKNKTMVQHLLDIGIDVNLQDVNGRTALMIAIEKNFYSIINVMLKFNPNLHIHDKIKKVSTLQLLLEKINEGIHQINIEYVYEVLKLECKDDNEKIAMRLVDANCPVYTAAGFRNAEVLRIMLENGCSVNERMKNSDWTALHVAFDLNDLPCAMVLLKHGANVETKCRYRQKTPFSLYNQFDDSDLELEVLQIILSQSYSLTGQLCSLGRMPIENLLSCGKKRALEALFRSDVDLSATDRQNRTSLHYLAMNPTLANDEELIGLLRNKKLNIHKFDNHGKNAVLKAVRYGSSTLLKFLLERNAHVSIRQSNIEYAPLHLVYMNSAWTMKKNYQNYYKCAKLLLQYGADPQEILYGSSIFVSYADQRNFTTTKLILTHLAIMEARGIQIIDLIRNQINSHQWLINQFNLCKLQLNRFKKIRIPKFITLFEFMCKSQDQMALCLRNDEFFVALKDIGERYKNESDYFNIFWGYLEKPLEKAQVRREVVGLVCELTGFSYYQHHVIIVGILEYFKEKDLEIYKN